MAGALLASTLAGAMAADASGTASPYLSAFEAAAGSKTASMSVDGKLGGYVLGPNKLVIVDEANRHLWLITTQDGCGQPSITDDGSVVTSDGKGHVAACHFRSIQSVDHEKLSQILIARHGDADIFGSLPLLGPPPAADVTMHATNVASKAVDASAK